MTISLRLPAAALVALLALWPAALAAAPLDRDVLADRLYERLAAAATEEEGRHAEDAVWEMWIDHPDAEIRDAIALGMRQRESYDWDAALKTFSGVIERDPDYAEGWNQRAFIHFLKGDYDASLADLDKTLELEPRHFGALAGMALIYLSTNRFDEGQKILRQAVALHPFLKERSMLVER